MPKKIPTIFVAKIKAYLSAGFTDTEIGDAFRVHRNSIHAIRSGQTYPRVRPKILRRWRRKSPPMNARWYVWRRSSAAVSSRRTERLEKPSSTPIPTFRPQQSGWQTLRAGPSWHSHPPTVRP